MPYKIFVHKMLPQSWYLRIHTCSHTGGCFVRITFFFYEKCGMCSFFARSQHQPTHTHKWRQWLSYLENKVASIPVYIAFFWVIRGAFFIKNSGWATSQSWLMLFHTFHLSLSFIFLCLQMQETVIHLPFRTIWKKCLVCLGHSTFPFL